MNAILARTISQGLCAAGGDLVLHAGRLAPSTPRPQDGDKRAAGQRNMPSPCPHHHHDRALFRPAGFAPTMIGGARGTCRRPGAASTTRAFTPRRFHRCRRHQFWRVGPIAHAAAATFGPMVFLRVALMMQFPTGGRGCSFPRGANGNVYIATLDRSPRCGSPHESYARWLQASGRKLRTRKFRLSRSTGIYESSRSDASRPRCLPRVASPNSAAAACSPRQSSRPPGPARDGDER